MLNTVYQFSIKDTSEPYSHQVIKKSSLRDLFRPRTITFIMALFALERDGLLSQPGDYKIIKTGFTHVMLFKGMPRKGLYEHLGD